MSDLPPRPPEQFIEYGHTDAAMLAYGRACERAAYERAVQECENEAAKYRRDHSKLYESTRLRSHAEVVAANCAAAIRALGADK